MLIITFINEHGKIDEYECNEIEFLNDCIFADGLCIFCKNIIKIECENF